ncbi:MAG: MFS transporter [Alphaproteobacteria bacterium]|nr:MFS transporter [Alphaproteobacteria bacterium]
MTPRRPLNVLLASRATVGIQALMLSPLVPDIAAGLATGVKEVGFGAGAYGGGVALAALLAAPRLGRWPKRTAIRIAFAVLSVALLVCGLAGDWRVFAFGQFVVGLASGIIIAGTYALTADIADPADRAQATGRVLFGWSVSMVAGVPFASLLSAAIGWRGTFMVVAAIAALMVVGGSLLPRGTIAATGEATRPFRLLRLPGAALGYGATFAYMIGFYQTYTFIGDHVRLLHGKGAWLGGAISLAYAWASAPASCSTAGSTPKAHAASCRSPCSWWVSTIWCCQSPPCRRRRSPSIPCFGDWRTTSA